MLQHFESTDALGIKLRALLEFLFWEEKFMPVRGCHLAAWTSSPQGPCQGWAWRQLRAKLYDIRSDFVDFVERKTAKINNFFFCRFLCTKLLQLNFLYQQHKLLLEIMGLQSNFFFFFFFFFFLFFFLFFNFFFCFFLFFFVIF